MKRFLFIGIDFSKSKFDVSVMECIDQAAVICSCLIMFYNIPRKKAMVRRYFCRRNGKMVFLT